MSRSNGHHPQTGTVHTIEPANVRGDLDTWDTTITELDQALATAAAARLSIDQLHRTLECIEAGHVLSIEGGNAETRKARLTLVLADDARYQTAHCRLSHARQRLLYAERRVMVSKERSRLLWAVLAIHADS